MRLPCNERLQTWTVRTPHPVTVDFLIPPIEEKDKGGALLHIESDLAAIVTPGLELAFKDRRWKELSGPHSFPVHGLSGKFRYAVQGAFTVLKALAFGNRAENKDAYDLFHVWSGVGVPDVAESLVPLQPNSYIEDALSVIERDFCHHDGLGPKGTAQFIIQELEENVQADVVGHAQGLLRSIRALVRNLSDQPRRFPMLT